MRPPRIRSSVRSIGRWRARPCDCLDPDLSRQHCPVQRPVGGRGAQVLDAAKAVLSRPAGSVEQLMSLAAADMAGVDALITARMQSHVSVIPALADHLIEAGGKRLRPLLTVAAA